MCICNFMPDADLQNVFPSFKSICLMPNSAAKGAVHVWTSTPGLDTKASSARPLSVVVGGSDCLLGITVILPFVHRGLASRAHSALLDGVDGRDECSGGHAKNDNSYYAAVASGLGDGSLFLKLTKVEDIGSPLSIVPNGVVFVLI